MEALLIKNDAWGFINGDTPKPELKPGDQASEAALRAWIRCDSKAKSDIILSTSPSELKQIKGLETSREVWLKLECIYASKGPARKATLLKQFTLCRMKEGTDVRSHLDKFFDAADKLSDMEVKINEDLLAIMLLYSLPTNFENFRCSIESRDTLPNPETLRIKIIEEHEARSNDDANQGGKEALLARNKSYRSQRQYKQKDRNPGKGNSTGTDEGFKFRCHRCRQIGHKAIDCKKNANLPVAKNAENTDVSLYTEAVYRATKKKENSVWCLDSGASSHLCKSRELFIDIDNHGKGTLNLANDTCTEITGQGTVFLVSNMHGMSKTIKINNALLVPDLRTNLLSVSKITDEGFNVLFTSKSAEVIDTEGNVAIMAKRIDDLYFIQGNGSEGPPDSVYISQAENRETKLWHQRMGHLNFQDLVRARNNGTIEGIGPKLSGENMTCGTCTQGKMSRKPFPRKSTRESNVLEVIHTDICGPFRVESLGGARYFITFIDDRTRWCEVRFLRTKDEAYSAF